MEYLIGVITGICVSAFMVISMTSEPAEYEIELINQNTVELKSNQHNKTWTTTPDSIVYYLELDNL